jgi:hypothetical protein
MTIMTNRLSRLAGVALIAGSVLLTGCDLDELLEVEDPDTVNPATLNDPLLLPTVVNGARGQFITAYAGGESYTTVTALLSDEYRAAGSFSTRNRSDRRDQFAITQGNTSDGTYIDLHQARWAAQEAWAAIEEFESTADPRWGEMKAIEAMTLVMLGEAYCSSAPVSNVNPDGTFDFGSAQSSAATLEQAAAIAAEAGSNNFAAVVRGRALLNLGRASEAAAAVANVPDDFVYYSQHSVNGTENGVWGLADQRRYSIPPGEGGNGIDFRALGTIYEPAAGAEAAAGGAIIQQGDPRMPIFEDTRLGFEDIRDAFSTLRYVTRESELPVATGVEARLIEAEAALTSNPGQMITILNDLRANLVANMAILAPEYTVPAGATLAPLTDPGTADARRDLLFQERAFWLFLTGHRLGDLRRLVANYGLPANTVYPTGVYYKDDGSGSDVYGDDVVLPIDVDELNNPNYQDPSLCDAASASFN